MKKFIVVFFVIFACCIEVDAQYMTARSIIKVKDTSHQEAKAKAKAKAQKKAQAQAKAKVAAQTKAMEMAKAKAKGKSTTPKFNISKLPVLGKKLAELTEKDKKDTENLPIDGENNESAVPVDGTKPIHEEPAYEAPNDDGFDEGEDIFDEYDDAALDLLELQDD